MKKKCPSCGTGIAALSSASLCPACLLLEALNSTASGSGSADPVAGAEGADNDSFGPYRILHTIGEGGMGTVYLAEQTHPIRRFVALKVVKLGMDTQRVLSRFDSERQALALMDHPHIAHVYDAGTSAKGRPYFVMEYVDGLPITQYCDRHLLNTHERLELFGPVCQALQHAHQKGVVHRDIKPSNVLVMEQDGKPFPKVIDFGISKAIEQRIAEHTAFTELGQFVGTPEYMSPEQADLTSQDVDTRTDVYSLGVLLYELLVGALPFDAKWLRDAGFAELLRIIREEQAPTPSNKLSRLGATMTEVARNRRTDPGTLRRELNGDLNWIVMKALDKDRRLRYASVSELAGDIRRHLRHEPVSAGPPNALYRAQKFVRRNRTAVIAASLIVATMLAGMIGTAWEARVAHRERAEAVAQRTRAEQHAREASGQSARAEVQKALAEQQRSLAEGRLEDVRSLANSLLFEIHDEIKDLSGATKARELLLSKAREYLEKLGAQGQDNPRLQEPLAAAYIKVGQISRLMVDSKSADAYAQKALELAGSLTALDPKKPKPWCLRSEAALLAAQSLRNSTSKIEQTRQAVAQAEKCVALSGSSAASRRQLADALLALGNLTFMSRYQEAAASVKRALRLREELVNQPNAPESDRDAWAKALSQAGFLQAGEDGAEQARVRAALEELVRSHPDNATFRLDLANFLMRASFNEGQSDRAAGAATLKTAIEMLEALSKADPANRLYKFQIAQAYGFAVQSFSTKQEALAALKRSSDLWEELLREEPRNPQYLRAAANVFGSAAYVGSTFGDPDGSLRKVVDRSLALYQRLFELEGRTEMEEGYARTIEAAAAQLQNDGETLGAVRLYRKAIAECDGPNAHKNPDATRACGTLLWLATRPTAAEGENLTALSYNQRAQAIRKQLGAGAHRDDMDEYREAQLGFESVDILWALDRYPEAIQRLQNAAAVFRRMEPTILNSDLRRSGMYGSWRLITVLQELALRLMALNREAEARKTLEEAVYYAKRAAERSRQVQVNVSGLDQQEVQWMYSEMARLCFDVGDRTCAVKLLDESANARDNWPDRDRIPADQQSETLGRIAITALRYGEVELFEKYYRRADASFDEFLKKSPNRFVMNLRANQNFNASEVFRKAGDTKNAAIYRRRSIEIRRQIPVQSAGAGGNPDPEYQFAQALELEGDPGAKAQFAKAAQALESALARTAKRIEHLPNENEPFIRRAEMLDELARSLMKMDRFDEALARAQEAEKLEAKMMSLAPRKTSAWQRRADTRRAMGEILAAKGDKAGALVQYGHWLDVGREFHRLVGTVESANVLFLNAVQDGAVEIAKAGGIEMVRRAMREAEEKARESLKLRPHGAGLMIRMAELPYEWARAEDAVGNSEAANALYARCADYIQTLGQRMTLPIMVRYELEQSQKRMAAGL